MCMKDEYQSTFSAKNTRRITTCRTRIFDHNFTNIENIGKVMKVML